MDFFREPWYLAAAAASAAAVLGLWAWADSRRHALLAALGHPATLSRLYPGQAEGRRRLKTCLQAGGLALLGAALAGPQWGVELVTTQAKGLQVMIAVDTSLSMRVEDFKPNRLEKAKSELGLLLDGLKGERVGVIAFAGEAHVQCPLTTDAEALRRLVSSLRVGMIPQPGSALGTAVRATTRLLARYGGHKALVILTDGEERSPAGANEALEAVRQAQGEGVHVYVIGVGTPEGEPIPVRDPEGRLLSYKKGPDGGTVISRLGEETLVRFAAAGGGAYYRATAQENEATAIVKHISELERSSIQSGSTSRYKNRYQIPLALALLLLIAEMLLHETDGEDGRGRRLLKAARGLLRRKAVPAAACLLPVLSGCGRVQESLDLLRGNSRYHGGEYPQSLERYASAHQARPGSDPPIFNAGDAQYRLGDYARAQEAFKSVARPEAGSLAPKSFYNLGNSHFRQEQYKEAVEAYKQCLLLDPSEEDCRFNLAVALEKLKEKPPPPPKSKDDQKKDPKDSKDKGGRPDQPDRPRPQASGMSQEDAERILQAVRERAGQIQPPKPAWQKKPPQTPDPESDW